MYKVYVTLVKFGYKNYLVCNPPLNPDLLPSWHFLASSGYIICSSHLILTRAALHCRYMKLLCVWMRPEEPEHVVNIQTE